MAVTPEIARREMEEQHSFYTEITDAALAAFKKDGWTLHKIHTGPPGCGKSMSAREEVESLLEQGHQARAFNVWNKPETHVWKKNKEPFHYTDNTGFERDINGEPYKPITTTELLATRAKTHGEFSNHAFITQNLKYVMRATENWDNLSVAHKESLEMIAHKIGRILAGDPNHQDHWDDICGYSKLASDRCKP